MSDGSEGGAAVIIMSNHTDYFWEYCKIIVIKMLCYCYYEQRIVYSYYENIAKLLNTAVTIFVIIKIYDYKICFVIII